MSKKIKCARHTHTIHIPFFPIDTKDANIALKRGANEMFPDNTLGEPLCPIDSNCYYVDFSDLCSYCDDVGKVSRELARQCVQKGMRAFPAKYSVIVACNLNMTSFLVQIHNILSIVRERAFDGKSKTDTFVFRAKE